MQLPSPQKAATTIDFHSVFIIILLYLLDHLGHFVAVWVAWSRPVLEKASAGEGQCCQLECFAAPGVLLVFIALKLHSFLGTVSPSIASKWFRFDF